MSETCNRCDQPNADGSPLEYVLLVVNERRSALWLCAPHADACTADVGLWQWYGTDVELNRPVAVPAQVIPAPTPLFKNGKVIFPKRERTEYLPDDETYVSADPNLFGAHDRSAMALAQGRFNMPKSVRATLLSQNLDPVDVLMAANAARYDRVDATEASFVKGCVAHGLRVLIDENTNTILGAARDYSGSRRARG